MSDLPNDFGGLPICRPMSVSTHPGQQLIVSLSVELRSLVTYQLIWRSGFLAARVFVKATTKALLTQYASFLNPAEVSFPCETRDWLSALCVMSAVTYLIFRDETFQ